MPDARNLLLLSGFLAAACASSATPRSDSGYDLQYHGSEVSLSAPRGLSMPEFLELAQQVTEDVYTYRLDEIAGHGPVTLLGRVRCERAEFSGFVQTMLYVHGLCLVRSAAQIGTFEVRPIARRS
jgi:hypothetical protein